MFSLRLFLSTVKSSKESSKVSFMICTNFELGTTNYILLYILLSCVIFTTLLTVIATNSELSNLTINDLCVAKSTFVLYPFDYKVCYTWFYYLNNLNKLFPSYCFIFYRSNRRAFYFHKGHAQKRQQLSPQNHPNRVQPHDRLDLKFSRSKRYFFWTFQETYSLQHY